MAEEAFPQSAPSPLEHRRSDIERQRDAQAQYFKVSGIIEVSNIGESQVRISFPVFFVNQPVVHFGGEVGYGTLTAVAGAFPSWSAMVQNWDFRFKPDGSYLYVGALFGIITSGDPIVNVVTNIHWSVEGIGLRNPSTVEAP